MSWLYIFTQSMYIQFAYAYIYVCLWFPNDVYGF